MPFSVTVWMAASLLGILDAANSITQERCCVFVSDKLDKSRHSVGFLMQSAFTGLREPRSCRNPSFRMMVQQPEAVS